MAVDRFWAGRGIQFEWIELTERIEAMNEHAEEMADEAWHIAKEKISEVMDSYLPGFPETLSEIESQLQAELMPFTT